MPLLIWDPVLAEAKKDGTVVITSGQITAATGKATFDGYVANRDWAKANRDFMVKFVKVMADADAKYRDGGKNWKADGAEVKAIAKWSGSKPEDVPAAIALYKFPSARSRRPLAGGGKAAIAAKALAATAEFQLSQKADRKDLAGLFGSGECQLRGRGGEIVIDHEA